MALANRLRQAIAIRTNIPYQLQRAVTNPKWRTRIAGRISSRLPSANAAPPAGTEELLRDGQLLLPAYLSKSEIADLRCQLAKFQVTDRYRPELGAFPDDSPPAVTHVADYATGDLLSIPKVLKIANDAKILPLVSAYLGCKPTISNIMAWWSYPGHDTAEQAENFHRDVDDWRFIKLFVYLTDVDQDNGPHCYVKGTTHSSALTRIRRYTDEEVIGVFGDLDYVRMTGKKGDAFLEDTFGLHKGQVCATERRLLLQVQYSLGPIRIGSYQQRVPCPGGMDPYINRLYCS